MKDLPTLDCWPLPARWLATLVLASYAANHAFASWLVWEVTRNAADSAQEHFSYKTLAQLLRMAHQHSFGHGTMYFLVGALFLFAGTSRRTALVLLTLPFLGAWLDIVSWFGLKYGSPRWEWLSIASGSAYSIGFLAMSALILKRAWLHRSES